MKKGFDWGILLSTLFIFSLGFSILFTQNQSLALNQLKVFLFGLVCFFLLSLFDYRFLEFFNLGFYFFSLLLLILNFLFGRTIRGSTRWLGLLGFTFQASEIVKPMLIISLAVFLKKAKKAGYFLAVLVAFLIPALLIFFQPDLGSTFILIFIVGGVFLFSRAPILLMTVLFLVAASSLPLGWHILKDYQKQRLWSFLNPNTDPLGANYNLIQSIIAIGSGRFFGKGLGFGSQSQLKFLPERHTDFIFASLAEELGFAGSLIFLALYFFLLLRILSIAVRTKEEFARYVALGIFFFFFCQFFINVGMSLGFLPVTGITLPLVSLGGSSLLTSLICLGIVESIACSLDQKNTFEIR